MTLILYDEKHAILYPFEGSVPKLKAEILIRHFLVDTVYLQQKMLVLQSLPIGGWSES